MSRPPFSGSPDDFIRQTAGGLFDMQQMFAQMMQEDEDSGAPPGMGAFAGFVAPMQVTPQVMRQVKALPVASARSIDVWYAHILTETDYEGTSLTCTVSQVTKEHGSNGLALPESDGLSLTLAMCAILDRNHNMTSAAPVLLGTIAKACLTPGAGSGMALGAMMDVRPSRPRKILFQTRGELAMIQPDLKKMGISQLDVAEQALQQSIELHSSAMNDAQFEGGHRGGFDPLNPTPQSLGRAILAQADAQYDPYVDEPDEPYDLGSWTPPREDGAFPHRWFAKAPDDRSNWKPTALCGWRTNLERAILREDAAKVNEIVAKRSAKDIREYVECRILLTKCAMRGLIDGCKLLVDQCGASVEGAQAPDSEPWWREVQDASGNCECLTPLHQAARNGQLESVKFLLERGADIERSDKSRMGGTALHHSVAGGQIDVCRLLCEKGANLTYEDAAGNDAVAISILVSDGDIYRGRVQEHIQQILREFDTRCSNCFRPGAQKSCPCRKERYCDAACQKERWKRHKAYHKEVVG